MKLDQEPVTKWTAVKIVFIALGSIAAFAAAILLFVFLLLNHFAGQDAYRMGSDSVPSLKAAVGKRPVLSMQSTSNLSGRHKQITYRSDSPQADAEAYIQYLIEEAGFVSTGQNQITSVTGRFQAAAPSSESGRIIICEAFSSGTAYLRITLEQVPGTLTAPQ